MEMTMTKSTFPVTYHDFLKGNGLSSDDTATFNDEPSLTRQEFLEECDINSVMKRYDAHVIGGPGNLPGKEPVYFDFAEMPQTLLEFMQFQDDAQRQFMMLPAIVRKEFDNNAHEFVAYASDPSSIDQMRAWGLAPPAKAPESPPAPDASPAPGDAPKPLSGDPTHGST